MSPEVAIVVYDGIIYRPAGFRPPEPGEYYINARGKVSVCELPSHTTNRTILRPVVDEADNGKFLNDCRRELIKTVALDW